MKNSGEWNSGFVHVTDLMPTILELAGANYPKQYKGNKIHPHIGTSLIPVLNGDMVSVHSKDGHGWELFEMKAYIKGKWKILRLPQPMGVGVWQLYDLEKDPAETTDLSAKYPDVKKKLISKWNDYARVNEVHDHQGHFDTIYRKSAAIKEKD